MRGQQEIRCKKQVHVCILPRCGMWAYEFLITVCVWERQYSGCSLSPVAPHPSGHKTPWQSVTSTLLFPPQRAMSVTEWSAPWMWNDGIPQSCLSSLIHHSHPHSWIFSLVLSLAHVVRLLMLCAEPSFSISTQGRATNKFAFTANSDAASTSLNLHSVDTSRC